MKTKLLFIGLGVVIFAVVGVWMFKVSTSEDADAGGMYFDLIRVDAPSANALVKSPLTVRGQARGTWYFEASFPVRLLDASGTELAVTPAQAQGDWMTEDFVPFEAVLLFSAPETETGILVLQNDNPSGLPENAKEVRIPVRFSSSPAVPSAKFDTPVAIRVDDEVMFPDGLRLGVKEINDSRCKPDVVCVWQGELSVELTARGGALDAPREIFLGTVNGQSASVNGYTFSLQSATERTATVVVSRTSGGSGASGITGYVHIGPTCPVEKDPPDPNCADRPYAVSIEIHYLNEQFYSIIRSGEDGRFRMALAPSTWIVRPQVANVLPACPEQTVRVSAGAYTDIDISCDSGIR